MNKDLEVVCKSKQLNGKKIAVGLCGGIGATESIKIIREIRRHGAFVQAYMTHSATRFITPLSVSWACSNPAILEQSEEVEHLTELDLVVIVPVTLNTLSKASLGISDNAVTLLIASQIGAKKKILFIPAMNEKLYQHPTYANSKNRLMDWGCDFLEASLEENRLKIPSVEKITDTVLKLCSLK